jgi:hypothetical protein
MIPGAGYSGNQLPPYAYNQGSYGSPLGSGMIGSGVIGSGVIGSGVIGGAGYPSSYNGLNSGSYPSNYQPGMTVYDRSRYPSRGKSRFTNHAQHSRILSPSVCPVLVNVRQSHDQLTALLRVLSFLLSFDGVSLSLFSA